VPGNLLAEGTISIGVGLRTEMPYIIHCYQRDAVAFQIVDSSDGDTARMDYAGKFRGVVRPLLEWTTDYQDVPTLPGVVGRGQYGRR
jgi:lipopolysaccharide transport system ATP-binding protein